MLLEDCLIKKASILVDIYIIIIITENGNY
jgi:hypothetical protein